ncbi:MAG TPA: RagB/SusD family nutrient uptake outer membrane protein [Flavisolibacter sp.]|nr:RagB/SusD family nutrient uptake outer membrane protein [Flavisolibacter sp.]
MKAYIKSNKYSFIVLIIMVLFTNSCKKEFLNREQYGALPTGDAITNENDMETALNGTYAGLRDPDLYGRFVPLFGDLFADNVYISAENSNRYLPFFQVNFTVNSLDVRDFWTASYNVILNANNIINSSVEESEQINQFKGEAHALRALIYFELVKHFAKPYTVNPNSLGVPIVLTYDPFAKPQRSTVSEVYTQIEADLTAAISLMTQERSSGYFSPSAATALLARMHQFKGEWDKALTAAENVITNSDFRLVRLNEVLGYWSANTARTDKLETLFEVVFDQYGNADIDALSYFYDQIGYGDALAAESLYQLYAPQDVRKGLILPESPIRGDVRVVNKYPNTTEVDKDEVKIIRMSEVYLIAAEAAYQLGDETLARNYLNAVATERVIGFSGYTSSGPALLEDILEERRKELAFEGHRYWDLVRYNRDVVREDVTGGEYTGVPLKIESSNFRRIFPIPQAELDANPTIRGQQNPGY